MRLAAYLHEIDKATAADAGVQAATDRYHEALKELASEIRVDIEKALQGNGCFLDSELVYAASARCNCGAGFAYPDGIGMHGSWYCSAVLKGEAKQEITHLELPFALYEIKSESQPSAYGSSTRPPGSYITKQQWWVCRKCQQSGIRDESGHDFACDKCGAKRMNDGGSLSNNLIVRYFTTAFLGEPPESQDIAAIED